MSFTLTHIGDFAAVAAAAALLYAYASRENTRPLPPGPKRLPIVGNILDFPKTNGSIQFATWAKEYGDVISLTVLGQVIVVLNSHAALRTVALVRSAAVSSRPYQKFADLCKWHDNSLPLLQYNQRWRDRRKVFDNNFRPSMIQKYHFLQIEKVNIALKRLHEQPNEFIGHIREYTAAVIMAIIYGYDVKNFGDRFVQLTEEANSIGAQTLLPGALIVNTFPILARLPPWMLGSRYVNFLQRGRDCFESMVTVPFAWARENVKNGTAKQSLVLECLPHIPEGDIDTERIYAEAFGVAYAGASDSTVSSLTTFVMAMVLYPEIQAKARAELDRVVGSGRLPHFQDRHNLPYLDAVLKEVLRWRPVLPQGVPHATSEDIHFENYYIPRDSIVILNVWALLHDPEMYPEPETFKPERHLGLDGKFVDDPIIDDAFGFGNRKCPGRYLADATLWIFMASMLSAYDIRAAKDANGNEIPVDCTYDFSLLIYHPRPFSCSFIPRNPQLLDTI